jgi:hypothetical protein
VENTPKQVKELRLKETSKARQWKEKPKEAKTHLNLTRQLQLIANQIKFFTRSSLHLSSTHSNLENTDRGTNSLDCGSPLNVTDSR